MKTHGEVWYEIKKLLNSDEVKFDEVNKPQHIPKRMSRSKATKYYNAKCRRIFAMLGYRYKESKSKAFQIKVDKAVVQVKQQTKRMLRRETLKVRRELEAA